MVSVRAPGRSKPRVSRVLSRTTNQATKAVAAAIGGLMNRIHRQVSSWVMTPPNSVPAAPPSPFMAAHRAIARWSLGPGGKEEVMMASEEAAMKAQLNPCTPRATNSIRGD